MNGGSPYQQLVVELANSNPVSDDDLRVKLAPQLKPSICIIAHYAYGAMRGGQNGHFGGAEQKTTLMARWLAHKGYRIYLITWDEGYQDFDVIDRVFMVKVCRHDAGIRYARF